MPKYRHQGDDSEWSHGKLFLENLANKFLESEICFKNKDYIGCFEILEIIYPDVNMFLSKPQQTVNKKKLNNCSEIINKIKSRMSLYEIQPGFGGNGKINYDDRYAIFNFMCYLKSKAKDRGLITKLEKSWIDKRRKNLEDEE